MLKRANIEPGAPLTGSVVTAPVATSTARTEWLPAVGDVERVRAVVERDADGRVEARVAARAVGERGLAGGAGERGDRAGGDGRRLRMVWLSVSAT